MNTTQERCKIAKRAVDLGLLVDSIEMDAEFHGQGEGQSQYIKVNVEEKGYSFTIRISDHFQSKSCGSKAELCSFTDGFDTIEKALIKIASNQQAWVDFCDEQGAGRTGMQEFLEAA